MSVHALKPTFASRAGYLAWRRSWKAAYTRISEEVRQEKAALKEAQKAAALAPKQWREAQTMALSKMAKELATKRVIAFKMNTVLEEAKQRRDRIIGMQKSLAEQFDSFPVTLTNCRNVDFSFNKGSLEFDFLPMWMVKANGKSFYVHHIDADIPWTTRELPEGSTRGMIRFKRCDITFLADGGAEIKEPSKIRLVA